MTDEEVKLCRFLEIMIEEPGVELEKTGTQPKMWGYRFGAGNAKPGEKAESFVRALMRLFICIKFLLKH